MLPQEELFSIGHTLHGETKTVPQNLSVLLKWPEKSKLKPYWFIDLERPCARI